ncbi:hypothetical protein SLOPH_1675 [Spraguea lophii 42_110]|uniref:Uncharacterized protein n=1 Tax=Spraguea lophii (strain 42_110) TaxID=1358809 RepID=S7XIK6_SPRLO|nr:hypothetical protein SLOPH_1675 [Spraguea lophii 42_110]
MHDYDTIYFEKNNKIVKILSISELDPFTLISYEETIHNTKDDIILFAMLICDSHKSLYLAENILNLRYGRYGKTDELCIYELMDPITRLFCNDIHYYKLRKKDRIAKFMGNEKVLLSSEYINVIWDKDTKVSDQHVCKDVVGATILCFIIIYLLFLAPFIIDKYRNG